MAKKSDRRFWLFKSDPDEYSIIDLLKAPEQTTVWTGIRNYQARNSLRDSVKVGDGVLFYHSSSQPLAIVGTAQVTGAARPDQTAFDPKSTGYDPKSSPEEPTWYAVEIRLEMQFVKPVTRERLAAEPALKKMVLLQRGSRLSIQPVTRDEWLVVHRLAGVKPGASAD